MKSQAWNVREMHTKFWLENLKGGNTIWNTEAMDGRIILWHVDPLLSNDSVNTFPRRQILDKQPVAT
jgi:hypothetical protein